MRNRIRLTESDLHRIVKESVNRVLNEVGETDKGQNLLGQLNMRKRLGRKHNQAKEVDDYAHGKWDKGEEWQTYPTVMVPNQEEGKFDRLIHKL